MSGFIKTPVYVYRFPFLLMLKFTKLVLDCLPRPAGQFNKILIGRTDISVFLSNGLGGIPNMCKVFF